MPPSPSAAPPVPFDNQQRLLTVYSWNGTSFEQTHRGPGQPGHNLLDRLRLLCPPAFDRDLLATQPADYTTTTYNRLGRTLSTTDPRGVTHLYTYAPNAAPGDGQVTDNSVNLTNAPGVRQFRPVDRHDL